MFDVFFSTVCGRLTSNPEIKTTKDGKQYTTFPIAVNQNKGITNYVSVYAFDQLSNFAKDQLKTGLRVTVLGNTTVTLTNTGKPHISLNATAIFPSVVKHVDNAGTTTAESSSKENTYA